MDGMLAIFSLFVMLCMLYITLVAFGVVICVVISICYGIVCFIHSLFYKRSKYD